MFESITKNNLILLITMTYKNYVLRVKYSQKNLNIQPTIWMLNTDAFKLRCQAKLYDKNNRDIWYEVLTLFGKNHVKRVYGSIALSKTKNDP